MVSGMKDLFGDQPYVLPDPPKERAFGGETYDADRDHARLSGQLSRVFQLMKDSRWRSLDALVDATGGTVASVSARLRDLRKKKYGEHIVERKHIKEGLFLYRVIPNVGE